MYIRRRADSARELVQKDIPSVLLPGDGFTLALDQHLWVVLRTHFIHNLFASIGSAKYLHTASSREADVEDASDSEAPVGIKKRPPVGSSIVQPLPKRANHSEPSPTTRSVVNLDEDADAAPSAAASAKTSEKTKEQQEQEDFELAQKLSDEWEKGEQGAAPAAAKPKSTTTTTTKPAASTGPSHPKWPPARNSRVLAEDDDGDDGDGDMQIDVQATSTTSTEAKSRYLPQPHAHSAAPVKPSPLAHTRVFGPSSKTVSEFQTKHQTNNYSKPDPPKLSTRLQLPTVGRKSDIVKASAAPTPKAKVVVLEEGNESDQSQELPDWHEQTVPTDDDDSSLLSGLNPPPSFKDIHR